MSSLHCVEEPVQLLGNFQSEIAQTFQIYFEKCDPKVRKTCKPEKEVREWLKNKFLNFCYNQNIL